MDRANRLKNAPIAIALLVAACASPRTPAQLREARAHHARGDVVVAAVWPWQARREIRYRAGLQLAVEEVNARGGIGGRPLRLRLEDDGGSLDQGLQIAQRLADDPAVAAVIGHLHSYVTLPAAAIYDLAGLPLISATSTSPALTAQGYQRVFRSIFSDEDTGARLAELAGQLGCRRVAIYYVRNPYGRALANAFEERAAEAGMAVVARASHDAGFVAAGAQAFEPTLTEWAHLELDGIFVASQVPLAGQLIAAIRARGITARIFGADAMSSPALLTAGGAAVEGTIVATTFDPAEPRPEVQRFVAAFRRRFGSDPDPGSALGYDAIHLLADAMERAGSVAPDAVARALHTAAWSGVTGTLAFDAHGNRLAPRIITLVVRRRRFELLPDSALGMVASSQADRTVAREAR